jgi:hypothetical protein
MEDSAIREGLAIRKAFRMKHVLKHKALPKRIVDPWEPRKRKLWFRDNLVMADKIHGRVGE